MINREALAKMLQEDFNNNLRLASKKLGISPATICQLKNGQRDAGAKTITKLSEYCKSVKKDINDYIFL